MRIIYVGNFDQRSSADDEGAICHALTQLGHDVQRVREIDGHVAHTLEGDFCLFHHWRDYQHIAEILMPKVAWTFDLITYPDPTLDKRSEQRLEWMRQLRNVADMIFMTDGDYVKRRGASTADNISWLPQGADERVTGFGKSKRELPPILFTGIWRGGQQRQSFVDEMKARYGDKFHHVEKGVYGRDLANLIAGSKIVVAPDGPVTDRYWCVDESTEALTKDGWRRHDELLIGQDVYTINPQTSMGEWQPIEGLFISHPDTFAMWSMEGQRHSSLTTLDHNWFVEMPSCVYVGPSVNNRIMKPGFRKSSKLLQGDRIPVSAPCAELPHDKTYPDAFVELVAWAWTEGSGNGMYKVIDQSHVVNADKVSRIRNCLTSLYGVPQTTPLVSMRGQGPLWRELNGKAGITRFSLNSPIGKRLWEVAPGHRVEPSFIAKLTREQLELFISTSIDADGCRKTSRCRGKEYRTETFFQKDENRMVGFELACVLTGKALSRINQSDGNLYHIKTRRFTAPLRPNRFGNTVKAGEVQYTGIVWCPTTRNGTWLAKRRGTVYFTGNSNRAFVALGFGAFLMHPYCERLAEFYTDSEIVFYRDRTELYDLIDRYLDLPERRQQIAEAGLARTLSTNLYRHRCEKLIQIVKERLL